MFTQKSIKIFHSVQEIRPFSLFQNLALGKTSTDDKCHFAIVSLFFQNLNLGKNSTNLKCHLTISLGTSCQYQCVCKISSQYSTQFKRQRHYHFFRIWSSAKPRPMKNLISQSLRLYLVNINVYATVYQNIPPSLRDRAIFTFSEFEPRQNLDQSQMSFDYLMGYIMSISMCMQNFITIFHSVQEIGPFSFFQNLEHGKASTDEKCHFAISWARSC